MVLDQVVLHGWCVGCGTCAAICPKNRLEMRWNDRGEYNPVERTGCDDCGEKCKLCYSVCPAHGNTKNETEMGRELYGNIDQIQYRKETGYFLTSYIGYANRNNLRENGASGGMATWTLETLLESGEVDAIAAVERTKNPEKFFEFQICKTTDEIRQCSRSAYYPVEISRILKHIMANDGRYAVIGLPCVCKAIRLAQEKFPKLKKRIRYMLGITCGHSCSRYFAEYICALGGGETHHMTEFLFRAKDPHNPQPANNYGFYFKSGKNETEKSRYVYWQDGVGFAFMNGLFQIPGCFYCDDVFAECADVTFMDAWLPGYSNQPEGHSIVLVRDLRINELLETAIKNGLSIKTLSGDQVVESQRGGIALKSENREIHLNAAVKGGKDIPSRRKPLRYFSGNIFRRWVIQLHTIMASESTNVWQQCNKDIACFNKAMGSLILRVKIFSFMERLYRAPFSIWNKLFANSSKKNKG